MPAGRAEGIGGADDPRSGDLAGLHRLRQADVVPRVGTDVAHRGEARLQGGLGVLHREHRPEAVVELQVGIAAVGRVAVEVGMHVDQARQQGHPGQVDAARALGDGIADAADRGDPAVADHQLRVVHQLPAAHVQHARRGEDRGVLRQRAGRRKAGDGDAGGQQAANETHGGAPGGDAPA